MATGPGPGRDVAPAPAALPEDLAALDRAVAALELQRAVLGDAVVDAALAPLRAQRARLGTRASGEQRKLVTVVFADLVDFTGTSAALDPEDVRALVHRYFVRWRACVEAEGGTVEKFIGDAVMAVFGLRRSWEDDAERAVRAALAMRAELATLNDDAGADGPPPLRMRVGVDSGEVVVGTLGERGLDDLVVVGDTVNRASRLQAAAPPDGVLVSAATRRLVRGVFVLEPRPGLVLKGFDAPVDAFLVRAARPRAFRLDAARGVEGVTTPTVGRDAELATLRRHVEEVEAGAGCRVVTVVGDAGVGKTRLLRELDTWLGERVDDVWWFRGRAWASSRHRPGALLRDVLATRFGVRETDPPDTARDAVRAGITATLGQGRAGARDDLARAADHLAAWLGLGPPVETEARALRDEAERTLTAYLAALAAQAAVVVLLEDLHWADAASLHWLEGAERALRATPVLVVATARPDFLDEHPGWTAGATVLELGPLDDEATARLVHELLAPARGVPGAQVPGDVVELVRRRCEGNPFYAEELAAWLVDQGVADAATRLPTTLRAVLQARLDALEPDERATLGRAAVVGRVFWDRAVAALASDEATADDEATGRALDALRAHGLVLDHAPSTFDGARELAFRHALLRDVAYATLLREHRRVYHRRAAAWLERVAEQTGRGDEHAALVAQHHDHAGDAGPAARWYVRAGRQAARVYALDDALTLLDRALALAPDPGTRLDALLAHEAVLDRRGDRAGQDTDLAALAELVAAEDAREASGRATTVDTRARLDAVLARVRRDHEASRYDDALAGAAAAEARADAAGLGDLRAEAALWAGRALAWSVGGAQASERLDHAYDLARAARLPGLAAEALRHLGIVAEDEGRYTDALDLAERAGALFAEAGDTEGEGAALYQRGVVASELGRVLEARAALERALPVFDRSGHRYRAAVARNALADVLVDVGVLDVADALLAEALPVLRDIDDQEAVAVTLLVLAQVDVELGRLGDAAAHAEEGLALAVAVGSDIQQCDAHHRLAVVATRRGHAAAAVRHAARAVDAGAHAPGTNEEATAWLGLGHARLAARDATRAAETFRSALVRLDALGVPARSWEGDAGLARALLAAGRTADARDAVGRAADGVLDSYRASGRTGAGDDPLTGAQAPATLLRCALDVVTSVGDPRAAPLERAAAAWLGRRARCIADDATRAAFLRSSPLARLAPGAGAAGRA